MLPHDLQRRLNHNNNHHLLRKRRIISKREHHHVISDGKACINFASNDYLHLSQHPLVIKAFRDSALTYGLGSGGSALISGYHSSHHLLEEMFADFLQRDKALLFNSGYHANIAVMTSLANRTSTIIVDKSCHASLSDGILLSRAKYFRYPHLNHEYAKQLLQQHCETALLLVSESIFSMEGNITDIKTLATIAKQFPAMLIVDDAHGVGVLGKTGAGICEHAQLSQVDVPCLITPLGKAFGSFGAIVSGSQDVIEALIQFSNTYRYSTALPPALCDATIAALKILQSESWRRKRLALLSQFFNQEADKRGLLLFAHTATPIKAIMISSNERALDIQKKLFARGMLVACIRPPTVPHGTTRLRISLSCMHSESEIINLLDQLSELLQI